MGHQSSRKVDCLIAKIILDIKLGNKLQPYNLSMIYIIHNLDLLDVVIDTKLCTRGNYVWSFKGGLYEMCWECVGEFGGY